MQRPAPAYHLCVRIQGPERSDRWIRGATPMLDCLAAHPGELLGEFALRGALADSSAMRTGRTSCTLASAKPVQPSTGEETHTLADLRAEGKQDPRRRGQHKGDAAGEERRPLGDTSWSVSAVLLENAHAPRAEGVRTSRAHPSRAM
mgnify:CR=1 FL=1